MASFPMPPCLPLCSHLIDLPFDALVQYEVHQQGLDLLTTQPELLRFKGEKEA